MTEQALSPAPRRTHVLLTDEDTGHRSRRPADALWLLLASAWAVVGALAASGHKGAESTALQSFADLFGWFDVGWRCVYVGTVAFAILLLVETLIRRQWSLARDEVLALALVVGGGLVIGRATSGSWPDLTNGFLSASTNYPALRLAAVTALLVVAGPSMNRPARRLGLALVALCVPALLALQVEYPSSLLGGLAVGTAAAALVRLALGSSAGFPSRDRVLAGLDELGLRVAQLRVSPRQRSGAAVFDAIDVSGDPLLVVVVGRDAKDAQWAANIWRRISLRDAGQGLAAGRLQQVEHESLMTLLAERSSVRVPRVVEVGRGRSGDAMLVLAGQRGPSAEELDPADVDDELLTSLWLDVARLQDAGIAHGQLHLGNVLVVDGTPLVDNFSFARLSATQEQLRIDLAELLVSTTVVVGPERAFAAASTSLGADRLKAALPFVQRAALTPHTRDRAHDEELGLRSLRKAIAEGTGIKVPELAALRRISLKGIALMALLTVAAYLLVGQLAQVGFDTIVDQLSTADWAWVAVAFVLAQATFVALAVALSGSILQRIPLLPAVVLESALKFINLTIPTTGGTFAVNIRFLQKLGVPTGEAVASGAVYSASGSIVQTVMFLLVLPFVDLAVTPTLQGSTGTGADSSLLWLGVAVVVVAGVAIVVALTVPALRAKVLPMARQAWASLGAVIKDGRRRSQLFGGRAASQILFALTLGSCCLAYGAHVGLAELLFVNTGTTVLSGVLPVPGGIGVAEASLTAGLTAVGVDPSIAFAAALTHRLCTFYLPPIWGYFSLRWLGRHGYV